MFNFLSNANTAAKFRSVFSDFPFFNYVQSKALDDVSIIPEAKSDRFREFVYNL